MKYIYIYIIIIFIIIIIIILYYIISYHIISVRSLNYTVWQTVCYTRHRHHQYHPPDWGPNHLHPATTVGRSAEIFQFSGQWCSVFEASKVKYRLVNYTCWLSMVLKHPKRSWRTSEVQSAIHRLQYVATKYMVNCWWASAMLWHPVLWFIVFQCACICQADCPNRSLRKGRTAYKQCKSCPPTSIPTGRVLEPNTQRRERERGRKSVLKKRHIIHICIYTWFQ